MSVQENNTLKSYRFSFFESTSFLESKRVTKPSRSLSFDEFVNYSINNEKLNSDLHKIRNTRDNELASKIKCNLPFITPYGEFSYRNNKGIISYNRIIAVDIDNLNSETEAVLTTSKSSLFSSSLILITFCSISEGLI